MKKWLFIGLASIVVLSGVLVSCAGNGDGDKEQVIGAIQIPGGCEIKVVCVDFPKEIEVTWEKIGKAGLGQIELW